MKAWFLITALALAAQPSAAQPAGEIKVGYLFEPGPREALSLIDIPAENNGVAGAELAIADNSTTGRFLNQTFALDSRRVAAGQDPSAAMSELADGGVRFVAVDLAADALLKAADTARDRGILLFNVGAPDDRLREEDCRANVVHVAPTRSMLADALAQYLVFKQWRKWLLVTGSHPADKLYGDALRRAAKRFGAQIVEEREFEDTGGARQTDSGVAQVQRRVSTFTQGAPAHDVLVTADESEVFAGYMPYRTWDARPVAGSSGLMPSTWHPSHSQWAALQMQSRFQKRFQRFMTSRDIQAWEAVRMIGEAATRANSVDPAAITDYLKGPDFSLAAFKGQKLTVRPWNLQLRQPILLGDGRMVVSVSPQEGFLHQVSELDTLGMDRPESRCRLK